MPPYVRTWPMLVVNRAFVEMRSDTFVKFIVYAGYMFEITIECLVARAGKRVSN